MKVVKTGSGVEPKSHGNYFNYRQFTTLYMLYIYVWLL